MAQNYDSDDEAQASYDLLVGSQRVKADQEAARARKWLAEAEIRELELQEKKGDLLSRSANRDAAVVILAVLAQSLNSLPDQLERRCALTPKQAAEAQRTISEAMAQASKALKDLSSDPG